jgi:hypothetical protein
VHKVQAIAGWLLYGAKNGFTSAPVSRETVLRGLSPTLAGCNERDVASLAARR